MAELAAVISSGTGYYVANATHLDRFVVISGCSGGGKSTLLEDLGRRGHATVEEPGRRIVREVLGQGGSALPWIDSSAFARRAIAMALDERASAGVTARADFVLAALLE